MSWFTAWLIVGLLAVLVAGGVWLAWAIDEIDAFWRQFDE